MCFALLIRAFIETAANPTFRHSVYHEVLYTGTMTFFDTIKHYKENSPLNITVMSTKQWYQLLLGDQVQMSPANDDYFQPLGDAHSAIFT